MSHLPMREEVSFPAYITLTKQQANVCLLRIKIVSLVVLCAAKEK